MPLKAYVDFAAFKLFLLDVGLPTTANIYAHLDFNSKISSAQVMMTGLGMTAEG